MATPVIVVGASAGGVEALRELVAGLAPDFPSVVAIVLHIPRSAPSGLAAILRRCTRLPVRAAHSGEELAPGTVYVASTDRHLLIEDRRFRLSSGPSENGHRPAVDPLFRSAAAACGTGTVGVVLSGARDDGTAGLVSIVRGGGRAVVQDPAEALHPSMPASALRHVPDAVVAPARELGAVLTRMVGEASGNGRNRTCAAEGPDPEPDIAAMKPLTAETLPGTGLSCPTCQGVLFGVPGEPPPRFRCRVGHTWSPESLADEQDSAVDHALWAALRALEEKAALHRRLAEEARRGGRMGSWAACQTSAKGAESDAAKLRGLMERINLPHGRPPGG